MNSVFRMFVGTLVLSCVPFVSASSTYIVDILVFSPSSNNWLKEEVFGNQLPETWSWVPDAFPDAVSQAESGELEAPRQAYNPLPNAKRLSHHPGRVKQRLLLNAQKRLTINGNYRVLYQASFIQDFKDLSQATSYLVESDSTYKGQPEMLGWITLYRGRFLHVKADMLLTKGVWHKPVQKKEDEIGQDGEPETKAPTLELKRIHVQHRQKLRSGEAYYLDHPGLGMLIKLSPLGT